MLINKQNWYVYSESYRYKLTLIPSVFGHSDSLRRLYRVENLDSKRTFYKSISISRTTLTFAKNNGKSTDEVFDEKKAFIENELIDNNERNIELVVTSDKSSLEELNSEGGYKHV